ncbi:MAG: hypothetical protein ACM3JD_04160 [Rudaea sp.]
MADQPISPDRLQMEAILKSAAACLECDAPECNEMTPEGMDACADLPFWNGRPVTRAMLLQWQSLLATQSNGRVRSE